MNQEKYDVIIVGGGLMGSTTAYNLMKADDTLKVLVVEKDPTYEKSSTTLSMANIRVQFSFQENIAISQYAIDMFNRFGEDMAVDDNVPNILFHQEGNLFVVSEAGEAGAKHALELQKSMGCNVYWLSPDEIKKRYPLFNTEDCAGATFGAKDGHFDAYALLMGYKAKARSLGAEFIKGEVVEICNENGQATGVKLDSGEMPKSAVIINCAGAWASQVSETVGIKLPVVPTKRQVFAVDPAVKPNETFPSLTVIPCGLYFRLEPGGIVLVGKSNDDDPVGFNFNTDDNLFRNVYWPELAEFVPAFEELKLVRGWAGLYAVNTLDEQAIVGQWPELKGFYLCNGFSGHGLQQAPAVSRYLTELILGKEVSMDLSIFAPERILENKPIGGDRASWEIV